MAAIDFQKPGPLQLDGNLKENWLKFWHMFEIYSVATKTNTEAEEVQVARFLSCAGEKAIDIFRSFALNDEKKNKIKEVAKAFEDYCIPRSNVVYERYMFFTRNQKEGEPFEQFLSDLIKLAESCDFDTQKESMIRDRIVIGITDQTVRLQLLKTDKLDLNKAKELCRIAEQAGVQAKMMGGETEKTVAAVQQKQGSSSARKNIVKNACNSKVGSFSNFRYPKKSEGQQFANANHKPSNEFKCKQCNRKHRRGQCPAYGKKCLACGRYNHFALVCDKIKPSTVSNLNEIKNQSDDFTAYIDTVTYLTSIDAIMSEKVGWKEKLTIQNVVVEFKLDSGADVNIIPKNIACQLICEKQLKPVVARVEAYCNVFVGLRVRRD